jgi:hypothetical protein
LETNARLILSRDPDSQEEQFFLLGRKRMSIAGAELKLKRTAAEIPGFVVCKAAQISRSRLSAIELGYITPEANELSRITAALDRLIAARTKACEAAAAAGWPIEVRI